MTALARGRCEEWFGSSGNVRHEASLDCLSFPVALRRLEALHLADSQGVEPGDHASFCNPLPPLRHAE